MEKKICVICGERGLQICSGCRAVHYCSKDHQKSNWPEHKLICRPYRIEVDEEIGRHLVASKDFSAGAIILREEPLLIVPSHVDGSMVCLGCCSKLEGQRVACPNCKWPMCGKKQCIGKGSQHELGECAVLKAAHAVKDNHAIPADNTVYVSIMVLRYLSLRKRDPAKWEKLMDLKNCGFSPRFKGLELMWSGEHVVKLVNKWLRKDIVTPELIKDICFITFANSFTYFYPQHTSKGGLLGIYPAASLLDHNCISNANYIFTKDGKIVVRAAVPIAKGTKITLDSLCSMFGTLQRQQIMEKTKFGGCNCQRCLDPTELGTFTSGIYCLRCPNREVVLLPECPLNKDSDWVCSKCADRKSANFIKELLKITRKDLGKLNWDSVTECEAVVQKYEKILHPNHYLLVEVKMNLLDIYEFYKDEKNRIVNDENLAKKEALVVQLLKLFDVLSPGFVRSRGVSLYNLFSVLRIRREKLINEKSLSSEEALRSAQEFHKVLREAYGILSWNGEETGDLELSKKVGEQLKYVERVLGRMEEQEILYSVD